MYSINGTNFGAQSVHILWAIWCPRAWTVKEQGLMIRPTFLATAAVAIFVSLAVMNACHLMVFLGSQLVQTCTVLQNPVPATTNMRKTQVRQCSSQNSTAVDFAHCQQLSHLAGGRAQEFRGCSTFLHGHGGAHVRCEHNRRNRALGLFPSRRRVQRTIGGIFLGTRKSLLLLSEPCGHLRAAHDSRTCLELVELPWGPSTR